MKQKSREEVSDTGGKWLGRAEVASDIRGDANVRCLVSARQATHPTLVPQKKLDARPGAMSSNDSRGKVMNMSVDDKAALGIASGIWGALQLAHLLSKCRASSALL